MPNILTVPSVSVQIPLDTSPRSAGRIRIRSSSLSIARSPSILTRPLINPNPPGSDVESQTYALTRTRSYPNTRNDLEDIASDDGNSPLASPVPPGEAIKEDVGEGMYEDEVQDDEPGEEEQEQQEDERLKYTGGFQAPDTRELVAMALSFGAVVVLAVAAGLTTIYDWVL